MEDGLDFTWALLRLRLCWFVFASGRRGRRPSLQGYLCCRRRLRLQCSFVALAIQETAPSGKEQWTTQWLNEATLKLPTIMSTMRPEIMKSSCNAWVTKTKRLLHPYTCWCTHWIVFNCMGTCFLQSPALGRSKRPECRWFLSGFTRCHKMVSDGSRWFQGYFRL